MRRVAVIAIAVITIAAVPFAFAADDSCPPRYSYSGSTGPDQWARLDIPNNQCGHGSQSPIDITRPVSGAGPVITVSYADDFVGVQNTKLGFVVTPLGFTSGIVINNERFRLVQFHLHTPSEHKVKGFASRAELHLVHESASGNAAVFAFLMNVGNSNDVLAEVLKVLPAQDCERDTSDGKIPLSKLLPAQEIRSYYVYPGSLTTPPCTRGITFYLPADERLTLSKDEYDRIKAFGPNARPIQPVDGREVRFVQQ